MALRLVYPVASAHAHHADVAAKQATTHHHDQIAKGPISKYLSTSTSSETPNRYMANSEKRDEDWGAGNIHPTIPL